MERQRALNDSAISFVTTEDSSNVSEQSSIPAYSDPIEPRVSKYRSIVSSPRQVNIWLSLFGVLNLLIFNSSLERGLFAGFEEAAISAFGYLAIALSSFFLISLCGVLGIESLSNLKKRVVPYQLNLFLVVLILGTFSIYGGFLNPAQFSDESPLQSFLILAFFISFFIVARDSVTASLKLHTSFKVGEQIDKARVVRPENNFPLPVQGGQGELFPRQLELTVPAASLRAGDHVTVNLAQVIPCDGVITEGSALIKERRFSGLLQSRLRVQGDEVFAGSKVELGQIEVKVGLPPHESMAAMVDPLLESSLDGLPNNQSAFDYYQSLVNLSLIFIAIISAQTALISGATLSELVVVACSVLALAVLGVVFSFAGIREKLLVAQSFSGGFFFRKIRDAFKLTQLKTLAFVFDPVQATPDYEVDGFFVMDTRVDKQELGAIILALALRADQPLFREVGNYLLKKEKIDPQLKQVNDFREYPGRGVCATISGAEFTIGNEEFLMDRGVYLQSTEAIAHGHRVLYVAVDQEVIARFPLIELGKSFSEQLLKKVRNHGIRSILLSKEAQSVADAHGKGLGFELGDIFGGLDSSGMEAKVESLGLSLLVVDGHGDHGSQLDPLKSTLTVSYFDELKQDLGKGDIVLFSRKPEHLAMLAQLGRTLKSMIFERTILSATLITIVISLYLTGLQSPLWPLLAGTLSVSILWLESYRIRRLINRLSLHA